MAFAVVSNDGPSEFSQAASLTVYGGIITKQLDSHLAKVAMSIANHLYVLMPHPMLDDRVLPDMVENVQVTDSEDTRIGFFQHVRIHVSWEPPEGQ